MKYLPLPGQRIICWFSCGAASAVAAKETLKRFAPSNLVIPVYCDTSRNEHPDNKRFITDCERWLGVSILKIGHPRLLTVEEVFKEKQYMSGVKGAPCTGQLKKVPRHQFATPDDIHVFGFTSDEKKRVREFEKRNFDLRLLWTLIDAKKSKQDCYKELMKAGIELPAMYRMGYRNNNCLGCVKASSPGYWQKVRRDFPGVFKRRAEQSREIGCRLTRVDGKRIFLDELPIDREFKFKNENISCGPECGG